MLGMGEDGEINKRYFGDCCIVIRMDYAEDQIFILVDSNTRVLCLPHLLDLLHNRYELHVLEENVLVIPAGEEHKSIETILPLWHALVERKATRKALLFNLGGGVVTDMGGFVASTYRRGIDYINVPTTLLSMVDAGHGGKTGFDFDGLKNEIGTFYAPKNVWIVPEFLKTLPREEMLSGYAELIKHALLSGDEALNEAFMNLPLFLKLNEATDEQMAVVERMINESIAVKQHVVELDPTEKGLRKCLNLGHTVGHAVEELSFEECKPLRHGYAVIVGLVAEAWLSSQVKGLDKKVVDNLASCMSIYYGLLRIRESHFDGMIELMRNDKKNASANEINFTLLSAVGEYEVNQTVSKEMIFEALKFINDVI